jgi:High-temperature-induced dauer-formation protein
VYHLASFFLLFCSGEREFSVKLNVPFDHSAIYTLALCQETKQSKFSGSYGDLLIQSLTLLLLSRSPSISTSNSSESGSNKGNGSLIECGLLILNNLSPFMKTLASLTCHFLWKLYEKWSYNPLVLYSSPSTREDEGESREVVVAKEDMAIAFYLAYLLDMFIVLLQYQSDGNAVFLVYCLKWKKRLESVDSFQYSDYIKAWQRTHSSGLATILHEPQVSHTSQSK